MSNEVGRIIKVAGPLVVAENMSTAKMYDVVEVSDMRLIGEIIEMRGDQASIQVYEETGGLGVGDPVYSTNEPLSVTLGPGMIEGIYDGIQRPLNKIKEKAGDLITRGVHVQPLDMEKKWDFEATAKKGEFVTGGYILGTVKETSLVTIKIMVPPGADGELIELNSGAFSNTEVIGKVRTKHGDEIPLKLAQRWPVRKPRPFKEKLAPTIPLITGQRVIDALFPIAKGGAGCVPGPFGSGKTVIQHQFAKWADAEIVVYIGCGERGNEMTDVLKEFPELQDPRSGEPLMKRTVLIANTSNMPVAAREASVYTGVTIAEYYRDMGYSVAVMADSTSRWAEAMREMSGRLEEMPGDEGYPAYLGTRIAEFYERAARIKCLGNGEEGALTIIGAVSPPGGDLSDPVVQSTLRVVKVFWSLKADLAYQRHFPAIDWLTSYTLYTENFREYFTERIGEDWMTMVAETQRLLQEESDLQEIVRLVGLDALSPDNRLIMEVSRSIREDFLHQNAFHEVDTFTSFTKQYKMLNVVLKFYEFGKRALKNSVSVLDIAGMPIREEISRMKYTAEQDLNKIDDLERRLVSEYEKLETKAADENAA